MYRPRLRTLTGCLRCKQRRKKCDGGKPRCAACVRMKSTCEWATKPAPTVGPSCSVSELLRPTTSSATIETSTGQIMRDQRIADHVGIDQFETVETDNTIRIEPAQYAPPTEAVSAEKALILHTMVTGIFQGWDQVPQEVRAQDLWSKAIERDYALQHTGHGMAARLAISLLYMVLMQYFTAPESEIEDFVIQLPAWYRPKRRKPGDAREAMAGSIPWPAIRERAMSGLPKYWTPEWRYACLRQGFRFIWPHQASSAVTISKATGLLCPSQELILRVGNIRSHVLTTDFIARYPELLGEAPQLEPSPTFYTPDNVKHIESLYWRLLKERSRSSKKSAAKIHPNRSSLSGNSETTVSIRESPPRIAPTLQDLLNPSSPEPIQLEAAP